ncbi:MAG: LPS-assembly lipoprotein [Hyphomicrobiaceae bacterium]|jgi:LPS-assembly lipoprotein
MRNFALRLCLPLAIAFIGFGLSACGFRPLYASGADGLGPGDAMAGIFVESIPERVGYQLRNHLLNRLGATGRSDGATYRLKISLREQKLGVAIRPNASITRYNYTLQARYDLIPTDAGQAIKSGNISALAAYNVATSPYATVVAEQDASNRAAGDIAERLRVELAVFFAEESSNMAASLQ